MRLSWAGNRRLLGDAAVRRLLLAQWLPPAFVTAAESLLVPYAAGRGYPAGVPGLLLACVPVGMIAGDVVVGRLVRPATRERLVTALVVVLGAPLLGLIADLPVAVVAALLAVTGTGFAYGLGLQRRFLDVLPAHTRGQAFGLLSSGLMTVQGLGPVVFGLLAEVLPVGTVIGLAGVSTVLTAVAMHRWLRR
jgi:predicted MFS family arabinose efflux permease